MATVEDKQVTFISNQSDNEEESDKSDSEIVHEQTQVTDARNKRMCYKIDKLFSYLAEDIHLLCEWELDEKKRGPNAKY